MCVKTYLSKLENELGYFQKGRKKEKQVFSTNA